MDKTAQYEHLNKTRLRYKSENKTEKKKTIFDEFRIVCEDHRKYAIRLL